MIAHLCATFGWTWDYVEQNITAPRLLALYGYMEKNPPLHMMVAAYLGLSAEEKKTGDLDELLAMFPDGSIKDAGGNDDR